MAVPSEPGSGVHAPGREPKRLADYLPPPFLIDTVTLEIDLREEWTTVTSVLEGRRNPLAEGRSDVLVLDGEAQELLGLELDGRPLSVQLTNGRLEVFGVGENFSLTVRSRCRPADNTVLEGLYLSNGMYCTQCEAEGFRRITWFPDRPDILAVYRTTIVADKARYPVLLSNGNLIESRDLPRGRHSATWFDPFPKPSYLFAMVAGDLGWIEDRHVTASGREVTLRIYVEHGDEARCEHAMRALKQSMAWDEERFGLEYDLDIFMIVAVSHFNMGAMENKGLNIFNSKLVLADRESATDLDFQRIEAVVAHEYFHNWTGNRVTCRDWFQLSLKEGLTVFRDQEFTADMHSRGVKRVSDARVLRSHQFPEDAGPTAHPVRPDSYLEINNFYTVTVYEKGAEVVRLIHSRLGEEGFRKGMDLYFRRHDGEAVTCEDFVSAMADANDVDLSDMDVWYSQAGTPELTVALDHDPSRAQATLRVTQRVPPTPGQPVKRPMPIPLRMGLLDEAGREIPLRLSGESVNDAPTERTLTLRDTEHVFTFEGVTGRPVPSLLRNFSAPVRLRTTLDRAELLHLAAWDTDPFVRWDALQRSTGAVMYDMARDHAAGRPLTVDPELLDAVRATIRDDRLEMALRAELVRIPSETDLAQDMDVIDVEGIHAAHAALASRIGTALRDDLEDVYRRAMSSQSPGDLATEAMGARALAAVTLRFMTATGQPDALAFALRQYERAQSMTQAVAALQALNDIDCAERTAALGHFHDRWRSRPLELDKWFVLNAVSSLPDTLKVVRGLLDHPGFDLLVPDRVRSLIGAFASANQVRFHARDGSGYRFLAEQLLAIDRFNPRIAARLATPLVRWQRHDTIRRGMMRRELRRILDTDGLSPDVREIAGKGLDGASGGGGGS